MLALNEAFNSHFTLLLFPYTTCGFIMCISRIIQ